MRMIGVLAGLMFLSSQLGWAADRTEKLTSEQRKELEKERLRLNEEGFQRFNAHDFSAAADLFRQALTISRTLFPKKDFPRGHEYLVISLQNMGSTLGILGQYGEAEPFLREAVESSRLLFPREKYPAGAPLLLATLQSAAKLSRELGDYRTAAALSREALDMTRALFPKDQYPNGQLAIHMSRVELAHIYQVAGDSRKAEVLFREGLESARALFPDKADRLGQMIMGVAVGDLATFYKTVGEYGKAEQLYQEAMRIQRARFPKEKYPNGNHNLCISILHAAQLYHYRLGKLDVAEPLYKEALQMARALNPTAKYTYDEWDLSIALDGLAGLYRDRGQYARAESLYQESLQITRALRSRARYPHGHPNVAAGLNNLAFLYRDSGEYARAEQLYQEALQMDRALYSPKKLPHGHPNLALGIDSLAHLYLAKGEPVRAERLFREALAMNNQLLLDYAELAAEAECLNYIAQQPPTRDAFLSAARHLSRADAYDALWSTRAALTRFQERRHRELTLSREKDTAELAHRLHIARLALARRLFQPLDDAEKQRAEVQKLTSAKEELEKRLAGKLELPPSLSPQAATPKHLAESLPEGTAFVDLYRYIDFEQDPNVKGRKGEKQTLRYVAFIVRPGKDTARIELGEAAPIEQAWAAWRKAITAARPDEKAEREAGGSLAKLVWTPLRKVLPDRLKTVYVAPAGVLHQVPWGAMPGSKPDTVLLEEHAVCLVSHGPFLLERLTEKQPTRPASDTLLVYGGIDYDSTSGEGDRIGETASAPLLSDNKRVRWGSLPGTAGEQEQIARLARKVLRDRPILRSGRDADTRKLEEDLPQVRYAHLATHGFFADPEFRSAFHVDREAFQRVSQDRRGGARSPLLLSGLVLAGANRTGKDATEDRGILTAETIVGLRLEGLELAVLSACESGLGEEGGSEGVYGLQRAFHLAGCRNVVASLWKVDDAATQALMALFYRNLWEKKLDPADALRQAQLTLYSKPAAIEVGQQRGFNFSERDLPRDAVKPALKKKRASTAQWGAFMFSGVRPVPAKGQ